MEQPFYRVTTPCQMKIKILKNLAYIFFSLCTFAYGSTEYEKTTIISPGISLLTEPGEENLAKQEETSLELEKRSGLELAANFVSNAICINGTDLTELQQREEGLTEEENDYSVTDPTIKSLFVPLSKKLKNYLLFKKELIKVKINGEERISAFHELDERNNVLTIGFFEEKMIDGNENYQTCFYIHLHNVVDAVLESEVLKKFVETKKEKIRHVVFYGYKSGGAMAHIASIKAGTRDQFKGKALYSIAYCQFPAFTKDFLKVATIDNKRHVTFTSAEVYQNAFLFTVPSMLANIGMEHSILYKLTSNQTFITALEQEAYEGLTALSDTPFHSTTGTQLNAVTYLDWGKTGYYYYKDFMEFLTNLTIFTTAGNSYEDLNIRIYQTMQNRICADELAYQLNKLNVGRFFCEDPVAQATSASASLYCSWISETGNVSLFYRYEISFEGKAGAVGESFFESDAAEMNQCIKDTKKPFDGGYSRFKIVNPYDSDSQNIVLTPPILPFSKCVASLEITAAQNQLASVIEGTEEEKKAFETIYGPKEAGLVNGANGLFAESCKLLLHPTGFLGFDNFDYSEASKKFFSDYKDQLDQLFLKSTNFGGTVAIASSYSGIRESLSGADLSECLAQPYKNCKDGAFRTVPGECPVACLLSPTDLNCARVFKCQNRNVFLSVRGDSFRSRWHEAESFHPERATTQVAQLIPRMGRYTTFLYHSPASFSLLHLRTRIYISIFHEPNK